MIRLNRCQPVGPPQAYKTFGARTPPGHMRSVSCADRDCPRYLNGWTTTVSGDDIELVRQACAGNVDGVRRHAIEQPQANGFVQFIFEAGQPCLAQSTHRVADRPPLFLVRNGDWRQHLGGQRVYDRPYQWVDDFMVHQDRVKTLHDRG